MGKFSQIWEARKLILEGVTNTVFKKAFIEEVAKYRQEICNTCEYNDGKCAIPGTGPCCGACGCSLIFKLRSMSSVCGLANMLDKTKPPKWYPMVTPQQLEEYFKETDDNQHSNS